MHRYTTILALLAWAAPVKAQAPLSEWRRAPVTSSSVDFSRVRRLIHESMAKESLPGLAIAVARGDSILWEEGFGWANQETRVPATAHTPFYLASVSKTITASALMVLVERGRLDLDRAANDYLRTAHLSSAAAWDARGATIRGLATHTSGLTTYDLSCASDRSDCRFPSVDQIIRDYGTLVQPPGEQFDYSNLGYLILGDIIARVDGRELGRFLREEVFRPLGMRETSLGVAPALASRTAVRYSWTRGPVPVLASERSGASSVFGSAHDLALFGMMHAKIRHAGARAILSDAAIDTMQFATVRADAGLRYGLGWWVQEDRFGYRSVLAQGGTDAAATRLRVIPSEGIVVAVLANKGVSFTNDVVDAAIAALLPRYAELASAQQAGTSSAAASAPPSAPPRIDSAYVGVWRGIVRAEGQEHPLDVIVSDSSVVRATVVPAEGERTGQARVSGGVLRLVLPGDRASADTTGGRRMAFYLRLRGSRLSGPVTTSPPSGSGLVGRVSYWVELRRR